MRIFTLAAKAERISTLLAKVESVFSEEAFLIPVTVDATADSTSNSFKAVVISFMAVAI